MHHHQSIHHHHQFTGQKIRTRHNLDMQICRLPCDQ